VSWVRTSAYGAVALILTAAALLVILYAAVPAVGRMLDFPGQAQAVVTAESATFVVKGAQYVVALDVPAPETATAAYVFFDLDDPNSATLASPHAPWPVASLLFALASSLAALGMLRLTIWRVVTAVFPSRLQTED